MKTHLVDYRRGHLFTPNKFYTLCGGVVNRECVTELRKETTCKRCLKGVRSIDIPKLTLDKGKIMFLGIYKYHCRDCLRFGLCECGHCAVTGDKVGRRNHACLDLKLKNERRVQRC